MRHHRLTLSWVATVTAILLVSPRSATADETLFDFVEAGPQQEGDYEASSGTLLDAGTAQLALQGGPDWYDGTFSQRKELTVQSLSTVTGEMRFTIVLDGAAPEVFEQTLPDGSDMRLVGPDGAVVEPWWIPYFNRIAREGDLRVVYNGTVPAGFSSWWLYFGGETSGGDREAVFTHASPQGLYLAADDRASLEGELTVISFVDGNTVVAPGLFATLDAGETATIAAASLLAENAIQSTGPLFAAYTNAIGDAAAPLRMQGTSFINPTPRYLEQFTVTALDADATVTFTGLAGLIDTWNVTAGTSVSGDVDVPDLETVAIESDVPVLVARHGYDDTIPAYYDFAVLPPVATDLMGVGVANTWIAATEDGTSGTIYYDDGTSESFSLDALGSYQSAISLSHGTGPAMRIIADKPIATISYGDGDGGEMTTFLPTRWLGAEYRIPFDAQYVFVAAPHPATTCTLTDGSGATSLTADVLAPPYAKKLLWGSDVAGANVPGPSHLICDMPVFAMAERTSGDDEVNLWPLRFFRGIDPDLGVSWGEEVQTRYDEDAQGTVTTPQFTADAGVVSWDGFEARGTTDIPASTSIEYLLSVDGGSTWLTSSGDAWRESTSLSEALNADRVAEAISALPTDTSSVTIQAVLATADGTITPVLDDIAILYSTPGELASFEFGYMPHSLISGAPLTVTLSARDADGYIVRSFEETVLLFCEPDDVIAVPATSPAFVDGELEMEMTLEGEGYVTLVALNGSIRGEVGPLTVAAPAEAASLEKFSGDDQFGVVETTLPEPIAVRALDADGAPAAGVEITFAITGGGGSVDHDTVITDYYGLAEVMWTLGSSPGANRLEADAGTGVEGSPAEFVARADAVDAPDPSDPGSGDGGCGCSIVY